MLRKLTIILLGCLAITLIPLAQATPAETQVFVEAPWFTFDRVFGYDDGWKYQGRGTAQNEWYLVHNLDASYYQPLKNQLETANEQEGYKIFKNWQEENQRDVNLAIRAATDTIYEVNLGSSTRYFTYDKERFVRPANSQGETNWVEREKEAWNPTQNRWLQIDRGQQRSGGELELIASQLLTLNEEQAKSYLEELPQARGLQVTTREDHLVNARTETDEDDPGPTNPVTPRPTTTATTNECGSNGEYYKICYRENAVGALNAPSNELTRYVNQEIRNNRADQGFLLIIYAPEDQNKAKREEQRIRIDRERHAQNAVQANLPSTHRVIPLSYARQASGDHPSAAYLIPDTLTTQENAATNQVGRNNQPAEALLNNPSKTINEVWEEEWRTQATTFRGSEQLTSLADSIYEQKGIRVYLATNQEEWQASDYDQLDEQLREQIRTGNSNANNPEKHPRPCTAYLLLDQQGIHLYQSSYCPLRHSRHEHRNEPSTTQATRLLTNALRQTRGLDAQELYLHAYRLAEEGSTLYDGTSEAEVLTNTMLANAYFETQSERAMSASQEIVLAKIALMEGNNQEALNRAREHTQNAFPRLQQLGADTAVQAAIQLGECSEIQATLNEVQEYLSQRGTTGREAQEAIRECQLQEARSRCEVVDNSRHTNNNAALEIVYVNDGLTENDFRDYTEAITTRILSTRNLNSYQQHILFRRTQSSEQLTISRGPLSSPRPNVPATKLATRACYGDIAVVLSEKNYLPSTIQGDGYVSFAACGSAQCMSAYALRSLAFSVFNLEGEDQTITGSHTFDPNDVRIQAQFSEQQQRTIQDYFNTRT